MYKKLSLFLSFAFFILSLVGADAGTPKGAKAIFDTGEGPSVGMSVARTPKPSTEAPVKKEKYTGISYQLMLLSDDGQFKVVPKSRVFKSGERMKMLVRTNRAGYMTIYNIGSSGKTNLLFNEYVDAFTLYEIPKNTNFLFTGSPGAETVLVMLSDAANPMATQPSVTASAPTSYPPAESPSSYSPPAGESPSGYTPPSTAASDVPPPPPVSAMVASIDGAKSLKGSKDIVVEDNMQNTYAVISPKNGWKPVRGGMKDIVLESSTGSNYGVVPASAVADGGILTLEIKLKHR